MSGGQTRAIAGETRGKGYIAGLIALAFAGWALASYDFNLLVVAMPDISSDLKLSASAVGLLGFIVYIAQFLIALGVGASMDQFGRKRLFQWVLVATAVFTGLTYFAQDFWQLALVRALAGGFATAELAVAITLVNEEAGSRTRGLLYSIVQGGFPVGVFLASGVYLAFHSLGWRTVFALGVLPLVVVIICRSRMHESRRWEHLHAIRKARAAGDEQRVRELLEQQPVNVDELDKVSIRQLVSDPSVRSQLVKVGLTWFAYGMALVATNIYITYWLTSYRGWSSAQASTLLLASGGIGFFFYVLGGWLGERYGRRTVLIVSAGLTPVLALVFLFADAGWLLALSYFFLFQTTNGTWSGSGYAYWAESFPTRVRGTACGFLAAVFSLGNIAGTGLWTVLIGRAGNVATWIVLAVVFSAIQFGLSLTLRRIKPGQQLEEIST